MYKLLLIIAALLSTLTGAQAQNAKRLRGQALTDSIQAAYKAKTTRLLADIKRQDDSTEAAQAVGIKALDEKNGFRTYRFGDEITKYPTFTKITETGATKYYGNPKENLKIGEADLKDISYGFYKGKLYRIVIRTTGLSNGNKVKAALEAQYGIGLQEHEYLRNYNWFGAKASLSYEENSATRDATIIFSDNAISEQKIADKKEASKKASSDL